MFEILLIFIYFNASCLMHDFFIGNASEFLPGPIYDLNQIGQVAAGTYNVIHFFFNLTFESFYLIQFILEKWCITLKVTHYFTSQFNLSNIERWRRFNGRFADKIWCEWMFFIALNCPRSVWFIPCSILQFYRTWR